MSELDCFTPAVTGPLIRTLRDKLGDQHDLRDYSGLDLTGANDMTSLLNAALVDSASNKSVLYIPAGIITLGSQVAWKEGASIEGRALPGRGWNMAPDANDGFSWLHIAHEGNGLLAEEGPPNQHRARAMRRIGLYRDQPTPGVTAYTPNLAHQWDVNLNAANDVTVDEVMFLNATRGLLAIGSAAANAGSARITLGRIWGHPLHEGIRFEHCYDIVRLDDVQFWPFYALNERVLQYTAANALAVVTGRNDNMFADKVFTYGYKRTIQFIASATLSASVPGGVTGNFQFGRIQSDNNETAVDVDGAANGVEGTIADLIGWVGAQSPNTAAPRVLNVAGASADIYIGSLRGAGAKAEHVVVTGAASEIRIGRTTTRAANTGGTGAVHFRVDGSARLEIKAKPVWDSTGAALVGGTGRASIDWWFNYDATVASTDGAISTLTPTLPGFAAQFRRIGNTVEMNFDFTVTDNGNGSGALQISIPHTAVYSAAGSAREVALVGTACAVTITAGSPHAYITNFDNSYPAANGRRFVGSVTYHAGA